MILFFLKNAEMMEGGREKTLLNLVIKPLEGKKAYFKNDYTVT